MNERPWRLTAAALAGVALVMFAVLLTFDEARPVPLPAGAECGA